MPIPGPSVLPQYFGGKPADVITQALLQRQAFDRQRDIDAVNTGIGLSSVDDSSQNPANQPGVVDRIKQAYQRVTGQGVQATPAQQAGTRTELNQMAGRQAGANTGALNAAVYGSNGNGGAPSAVASNGAQAGSYAPEGVQPTMRLPSGGVVQTAWTPYGQKMNEAKLTHDYMLEALGLRTSAQRDIAQGHDSTRVLTTGMRDDTSTGNTITRVGGTLGAASTRANASMFNHSTLTPFQRFRETNPLPANGSGGGTTGPLVHQGAMVGNQIKDATNSINADQKVVGAGLSRFSTPADSANYKSAASEIPGLKTRRDSLRTVYGAIASKMQGGTAAAAPAKIPITQAEYQALRSKGHADADILLHYTVGNQ